MILTGKAKEDFLKNQYKKSLLNDFDLETVCFIFNVLPLNHQYSDIIEWFDSVGIYIGITYFKDNEFQWRIHYKDKYGICKTRQEATERAIEQANKIYNERV